jgi:hypothetical protein
MTDNAQPQTFHGERGKQPVSGVTMNDLYRIVRDRVEDACRAVEEGQTVDFEAYAQEFCVEVEKLMGIFPNLPPSFAARATPAKEPTYGGWICSCGWFGQAREVDDKLRCPKCGGGDVWIYAASTQLKP